MDDSLLEPVELYNKELKMKHEKIATDYFEELVKKSNIDVEANIENINKINKLTSKINNALKNIKKYNIFKVLLIILDIICLFVFVYSFSTSNSLFMIISGICFALLLIISILVIINLSKKIKNLKNNVDKIRKEIDELNAICYEQMKPLNTLYDWNIPGKILKKTTPLINMDDAFDNKEYELLHDNYGLEDTLDSHKSTIFVESGSILGNPFLIQTAKIQSWYMKRYTGSIVISWNTTHRDSDGHLRTEHHTQTLHAHVDKPCVKYEKENSLIFGSLAAPNLSFSRVPSGINGKNSKEVAAFIKKGTKELEKKARTAVTKGTNFTKLGNDEFEVLFGGSNRDNEMEFRLMFTPLAQVNFTKLLKNNDPYGDDFTFVKEKKINKIKSSHSQGFDFSGNPEYFVSNSYELSKERFINYNKEYFKKLFYDFVPLLSVPVYQQYKTKEYIYKGNYKSNNTSYEHEIMANHFDERLLVNPLSKTEAILKTRFVNKTNSTDNVIITAYTFDQISHIENVMVMGGDGHMHAVPVEWIEFIPLTRESRMQMKYNDTTRNSFINNSSNKDFIDYSNNYCINNSLVYERGFTGALIKDSVTTNMLKDFDVLTEKLNEVDKKVVDNDVLKKMKENDPIKKAVDVANDIDKKYK